MSVVNHGDPPSCPLCERADRVSYSASRRDPSGRLVAEYLCRPCGRAFTEAEAADA